MNYDITNGMLREQKSSSCPTVILTNEQQINTEAIYVLPGMAYQINNL